MLNIREFRFSSKRSSLMFSMKFINDSCILSNQLKMQGSRQPLTRLGFEEQLIEKYTRAVYAVIRERLYQSTAFRIKISPDDPRKYLVHHYNQSREFAWSRHEFKVFVDEVEGRYECECKLWEHTGTTGGRGTNCYMSFLIKIYWTFSTLDFL